MLNGPYPAQAGVVLAVAAGKAADADGTDAATIWTDLSHGTRPVLHRLLLQHSRSAEAWAERRERFSRSMAAGCVAGWVVGLGDRAPRSLLYEPRSGQLLHTRLHALLDTARTLPLPEEVPFRLTRELQACAALALAALTAPTHYTRTPRAFLPSQDALGPSGAGAPLRAHCEAALRRLRWEGASAALLCILEAFAHDGLGQLAQWNVTASARGGSAAAGSGHDEEAVELALLGVEHKLGGADEGGVEAQVQLLVQQSTDELRLMAMPPSWKPWL